MSRYLDQAGLDALWAKLNLRNTEICERLTSLANQVSQSSPVYYDTVENWAAQPSLLSQRGALYIYADRTIGGDIMPGIKIGNGAALADVGFVDIKYIEHIADTTVHITQEERLKWNNKFDVSANSANEELNFTR